MTDLPTLPHATEQRPPALADIVGVVRAAIPAVKARIDLLVEQRLALNEEVRSLRAELDHLERMLRAAQASVRPAPNGDE